MTLKTIFEKPVDRPIEGVIKADDEASLRLEFDEYVLTNEVEKRLEAFLDGYNNYQSANGVWISGFFGSGKSHLLKMLALLLENREIEGTPAIDLFTPKCEHNQILKSDLKRAVSIPSQSILFNIDQKADVISKREFDALLAVFVKVFDEMCGYYGKQGHIARFERDLDSRGLYEPFKAAYEAQAGYPWQKGREQTILESSNISKAYAEVTGEDETLANNIINRYENQYRVSIEDFAEQVKAYIDKRSDKFRLNFFVDEVGQYIAGNIKLMTNLQTIVESLATKCQGRAWVFVTAQEEMKTVVGEMSNQQGDDFSKIQDRFRYRMKLTSSDVAEVIQKRLLMKNEEGVRLLSDTYHDQSNNFKTLFDFADDSVTYRNFQDRDHFIHSYPFIPFQFALFQSAIQNLSLHDAFEGKHRSVGERSMLSVFQQVAMKIGDNEVGRLATLDLMYEGIRTVLKSDIQRAVFQAEGHLGNPFAVKILKALFLVKYVREFKATIRNLSVLMLESFDQDLTQLRRDVEQALNLLEQQTYIQRTGDLHEYLTDEEKDVEKEIKNTEVETSDVMTELNRMVFDTVIRNPKIRYDANGQDYAFTRKIDGRIYNREQELAIHVISPFHESSQNESVLQMQNLGTCELMVVMPHDDRLMRELLRYKRTEKYIRQSMSSAQQDSVKRILSDKNSQNRQRLVELQQLTQYLLGKANLFASGKAVENGSEDAMNRIVKAFHELISQTYPNLRMLRGITYSENEIGKYLKHSEDGLLGTAPLSEAEQEMLAFIHRNSQGGVRTTIKSLLETFERKPYGWYYSAMLCILANLCARGRVEVREDGNTLENHDLERALRNTHGHGNVLLEPQIEFTASQIRALKEFHEDFFDKPPVSSEAKVLGKDTGVEFAVLCEKLENIASQTSHYPFLTSLTPAIETLRDITGKTYTWYLLELVRQKDSLLDMKHGIIDPIRKFMGGSQKEIFDKASRFIQKHDANFSYIAGDESSQMTELLKSPDCYKGDCMQRVKTLMDTLQLRIDTQVASEIQSIASKAETLKQNMCEMEDFAKLPLDKQDELTERFDRFTRSVENQKLIAVVRDTYRRFDEVEYPQILSLSAQWAQPEPPADRPGTPKDTQGKPKQPGTYVSSKTIRVPFRKGWLGDEKDVDDYVQSLREALMEVIRKGRRIQV